MNQCFIRLGPDMRQMSFPGSFRRDQDHLSQRPARNVIQTRHGQSIGVGDEKVTTRKGYPHRQVECQLLSHELRVFTAPGDAFVKQTFFISRYGKSYDHPDGCSHRDRHQKAHKTEQRAKG